MSACVFCEIVNGQAPAATSYAWLDTVAFSPRHPVTPGHMLIVPRIHVEDAVTDPMVTMVTFRRAAEYAARLGEHFNLIASAGSAATQTVFHLHVHVVPRREGDGLALPWTGQEKGACLSGGDSRG